MSRPKLAVSVQYAVKASGVPSRNFIATCARRALAGTEGEVSIRIVDAAESAMLNERYRGKPGPTNVLAFPAGDVPAPAGEPVPLGDVVVCAPLVASEAADQHKTLEAHWAHIVIHGCLHLRGYDHVSDPDAEAMERCERTLLAELGIADPYRGEA